MIKKFLISSIEFYRRKISPNKPAMCKFYPTCSQYAITSLERFGIFKGSALALWRLIRCSPFTSGGFDPVPKKREYYF